MMMRPAGWRFHTKRPRAEIWDDIEKAFQDQTNITGKVLDRIKGGLDCGCGSSGFSSGVAR